MNTLQTGGCSLLLAFWQPFTSSERRQQQFSSVTNQAIKQQLLFLAVLTFGVWVCMCMCTLRVVPKSDADGSRNQKSAHVSLTRKTQTKNSLHASQRVLGIPLLPKP